MVREARKGILPSPQNYPEKKHLTIETIKRNIREVMIQDNRTMNSPPKEGNS
jgi:hypothetical protein